MHPGRTHTWSRAHSGSLGLRGSLSRSLINGAGGELFVVKRRTAIDSLFLRTRAGSVRHIFSSNSGELYRVLFPVESNFARTVTSQPPPLVPAPRLRFLQNAPFPRVAG